jgi:hypothetical protein
MAIENYASTFNAYPMHSDCTPDALKYKLDENVIILSSDAQNNKQLIMTEIKKYTSQNMKLSDDVLKSVNDISKKYDQIIQINTTTYHIFYFI